MNNNKLRGRIIEKFDNQENFANALGITPGTLSKKLKEKSKMKREEIQKWCEVLVIPPDKIHEYFFEN